MLTTPNRRRNRKFMESKQFFSYSIFSDVFYVLFFNLQGRLLRMNNNKGRISSHLCACINIQVLLCMGVIVYKFYTPLRDDKEWRKNYKNFLDVKKVKRKFQDVFIGLNEDENRSWCF